MAKQDVFIGQQIDNFIVQERIDRGTRSTVYRAFQADVGRDVALKLIRIDRLQAQDENFHQQFRTIGDRIAGLKHIHIIPIYAYDVTKQVAYIAMEMTDGDTLEDFIRSRPDMDYSQVAHIITQLGDALDYAHQQGVYHSDLKPASVLLDDGDNVYITDFGLGKRMLNVDAVNLREDGISRNLQYLPPEQIQRKHIDERSNVFSLGVILYQMLTGRLPIDPDEYTSQDVLDMHLSQPTPDPYEHDPNLPGELVAIVNRAAAKNPDDRYRSVDAMTTTLNRALDGLFENVNVPSISETDIEQVEINVPEEVQKRVDEERGGRYLMPISVGLSALIIGVALAVFIVMRPPPVPTILEDETIVAAQLSPPNWMINNAQRALEDGGFIAYTTCNRFTQFHATRARRIQERAQGVYDLPISIYDSENSAVLESRRIAQAVEDGAAVLIHCTVNPETAQPALAAAAEQIPVIADTSLYADNVPGVFISEDNYELGYQTGEAAGFYINAELAGSGRVLLLDYPEGAANAARSRGIQDGLRDTAGEVSIFAEVGPTEEIAYESTQRAIEQDNIDFDVVVSVTDDGAYGAVRALEEALYTPAEIAVFSIDGERLARFYTQRGEYLRGTTAPNADAVSDAMVDAAVYLLGGGTLPEEIIYQGSEVYTGENETS